MAGFQLNLKDKKKPPVKGKPGFLLGKKQTPLKRKGILDESDSEDEDKKTTIDTFDSHEIEKTDLVIRPENLSNKIQKDTEPHKGTDLDLIARAAVLEGRPNSDSVIHISGPNRDAEEATPELYEKVPVEDFGAALLRGMGWKGDKKGSVQKPRLNTEKRKQGLLLGIGAKAIKDDDLAQELLSSKAKFSVPLVKKVDKK